MWKWNKFKTNLLDKVLRQLTVTRLRACLHAVLVCIVFLRKSNGLLPPSSLLINVGSYSTHLKKFVLLKLLKKHITVVKLKAKAASMVQLSTVLLPSGHIDSCT